MGDSTVAYCYEVEKVPGYVAPLIFLYLVLMDAGKGWSQTHAFFAIMGGFMLFVDGKPSYVLMRNEDTKFAPSLRDLKSIDFYFESDIKPITKEEIEDKSKADTLSKGLVVLQTGWFTLQCMSRLVEHLPLTELELVTVGFAVLSLVTYIFWWYKPHNVQCAFPVHDMVSTPEGRPTVDGGGEGEGKSENAGAAGNGDTLVSTPFVWRHLGHFVDTLFGHDHRHKFWHAMTVPTMFSGSLERRDTIIVGLIATIVATVFGAIHCVAWSFQFGSTTEQFLWRLSALAITCLPSPLWVLTTTVGSGRKLPVWLSVLLRVVGYTGTFLYIVARVILLVLAFLSLKSLPPGAYKTVTWTTLIPHI